MEIQVKVFRILPEENWQSKKDGTSQVKHSFVAKTLSNYARTMKFDVFSADVWEKMGIEEGQTYNVGFDADSREFNGKWYTNLNAWKAFRADGKSSNQTSSAVDEGLVTPSNGVQSADDIPF